MYCRLYDFLNANAFKLRIWDSYINNLLNIFIHSFKNKSWWTVCMCVDTYKSRNVFPLIQYSITYFGNVILRSTATFDSVPKSSFWMLFLSVKSRCSSRWYWRKRTPKERIFWSMSLSCNCCSWYDWRFGEWIFGDGGACPVRWSSGRTRTGLCSDQTVERKSWAQCLCRENSHQTPWLERHRILTTSIAWASSSLL